MDAFAVATVNRSTMGHLIKGETILLDTQTIRLEPFLWPISSSRFLMYHQHPKAGTTGNAHDQVLPSWHY